MAVSDHEYTHYLDLQTGAVFMVFDDMEEDEASLAVDAEPERYRVVEPRSSHDGFRTMEKFAISQNDSRARGDLLQALDRPRPFRGFRDVLGSYPKVREAWYAFEEGELEGYARDWLRDEGIDAELTSPIAPVRPPPLKLVRSDGGLGSQPRGAPSGPAQAPGVRIEVLPFYRDDRGGVFEPLQPKNFFHQRNVHVGITEPGAIRGNHYHPRGTEILNAVGPAIVRTRVEGVLTDTVVPDGEVWRFTIPPGVAHAVKNTGTAPIVLVSFSSEPHDPERPDVVRDVIME